LRATLDSPYMAVLLYAAVSAGAAIAAYFIIFSAFASYDDEGTLLVMLKAFTDGNSLYRDIYSPYGPFYFELFGSFFAFTGLDVTTDTSRSIVIVVWVLTSLLFGLAVQRMTRLLMLGLAGMIAAFGALYVLANEPMHPQGLCVLLLGAFTLLVASEPKRRVLWAGGAGGAILAALTLTKVNLGVFAIAAVALAAVMTAEPLYRRRWVRWPVIVAFVVMPVGVMARDFSTGWVRDLVLLELLVFTAVVVAASRLKPIMDERSDTTLTRWLIAAAIGFAAAFVAIAIAIAAAGTGPSALLDGAVIQAIRVRDVLTSQFPFPTATVDWAIASLAVAFLVTHFRSAGDANPSVWPGVLRILAGLTIWFTVARITPNSLNPSATNPDVVPMILAWVALAPPAGASESAYCRFLRVFLPSLAVAESLQVYPVAGSQMGIAALPFVPVGAICLADGLTSLRAWSTARGSGSLESLGVAVSVATVALAFQFAVNLVARPAATYASAYADLRPLPFAGATHLRLSSTEVATYSRLVELIREHRCTDFIGYPNINSLYLWSRIDPPPPNAPGAWMFGLDSESQQRVVDGLRASPRPCAIRNDQRADAWLHGSPPPDRPLVNYVLKGDFRTVERIGGFQFMLPIESSTTKADG
jgi:hypothetical protein